MPAEDLASLPIELWRCIIRFATDDSRHPLFPGGSVSFGWPCNYSFDASFFLSLATKRNLVLVSRQFHCIASEFLYETLHFRTPRHAIILAELSGMDDRLAGFLRSWTKTLYVTPVFDPVSTEEEIEEVDLFLRSVLQVAQLCVQAQNVLVQADSVTLFQDPTYQQWVALLAVLPSGLHHLTVENFLLGPVAWKTSSFSSRGASSVLRTLRLDVSHSPFQHHFPLLTHLWLFSWPTASKWDMPSLTHLYIDYFPGNDSTYDFWAVERSQLRLLHFGADTDFGLHLHDLPQRLQVCTPNLQALEYHCAGDLDITWDPNRLSMSLKRVTVRLQEGDFHDGSPLSSDDVLLHYTSAGFGILLELLTDLCPSEAHRWMRVETHLEKYSSNNIKLFILLPKRIASLLNKNDPPPIICSSRVPIMLRE